MDERKGKEKTSGLGCLSQAVIIEEKKIVGLRALKTRSEFGKKERLRKNVLRDRLFFVF